MENSNDKKDRPETVFRNAAVASASIETVERFGSATAEYIKAYTGVDYETGQRLNRGHADVAKYRIHPDYHDQNITQQAGYSAELKKTADNNAEKIISRSSERVRRTDDMPDMYGSNNTRFDHVEVDAKGQPIPNSGSQMKFVSDPDALIKKIAEGEGGGKNDLSRYQGSPLDLPTEQVEAIKEKCREKAKELLEQAEAVEALGKDELAEKLRHRAKKYEELSENVRDSGFTSEEARYYREHPVKATAKDILKVSHRAGVDGAVIGGAIGGSISAVTNIVAYLQDDKDLKQALMSFAGDTTKSVAVGYATAFAGSAIKGAMQQAPQVVLRNLSKTALPTMAISVCLETTTLVSLYVRGEISEAQFLEMTGEKGVGLLSSGLGATLGQIAIPIPVVGGLIGGMIGYSLSAAFYRESLQAFKDLERSKNEYLRIKAICTDARDQMRIYRETFKLEFSEWFEAGSIEMLGCLDRLAISAEKGDEETFASASHALAQCMGKSLQFENKADFDAFMVTNSSLKF